MSKTAEQLSYEIADEYLPDVNILGVDGPNTGLADEIINKILDAVVESMLEYNGKDSKMNYLQVVNILRPKQ